ncbi:hypothetical protein G9A89_005497 [Geosiphon pyriformis]|nr:hypothetical protein G9A89_005497 [Geosiphon pyriformis]
MFPRIFCRFANPSIPSFTLIKKLNLTNLQQIKSFSTIQTSNFKKSYSHQKSRILFYVLGTALIGVSVYFSTKPKTSTLSSNKFTSIPLTHIKPITRDTSIFRFTLPRPLTDSFPITSCVHVKDPSLQIFREYTPISSSDEKNFIDLLIKHYENGQVSRYIHNLEIGDLVEIRGPISTFKYRENMNKNLGMICGGTGITPMYQIINHILNSPSDTTNISLIYANKTKDDILLHSELEALIRKYPERLKIYYTIDVTPSDELWNQGIGYVSVDMVKINIPPPQADILILVCGPDPMVRNVGGGKGKDWSQGRLGGVLKNLGYNEGQVFKF